MEAAPLVRPPPLLDDTIKRECECDPAPLVVDERAINMGYNCVKCGHEVKEAALMRLIWSSER